MLKIIEFSFWPSAFHKVLEITLLVLESFEFLGFKSTSGKSKVVLSKNWTIHFPQSDNH